MQCPNCKAQLELTVTAARAWPGEAGAGAGFTRRGDIRHVTTRNTSAMGIMASAPVDSWDELRFEQPSRPASRESDVIVPLLQAAVSGAFAGVVVTAAAGALAWGAGWHVGIPMLAGITAAMGTMWARWEALLDDSRGLLRKVEEFTRRDNGIPQVSQALRVEVRSTDAQGKYTGTVFDELPIEVETLRQVLTAHTGGRCKLSRRGVADLPGIGIDKAAEVLAALESAGYLSYPNGRNHPGGAQLTSKGKAVAKAF